MKPMTGTQKVLLSIFCVLVFTELLSAFIGGFYPSDGLAVLFVMLSQFCVVILALICAVAAVVMFAVMFFKKTAFLKFTLLWLLLCVLGFPLFTYDSVTAGANLRIRIVGADQVAREGQQLLAGYKKPEHEGYFVSREILKHLPPAITKLHPLYVDVREDRVLIKMYGGREFLGFVVVREDKTLQQYKHRRSFKVTDGLYWMEFISQGI